MSAVIESPGVELEAWNRFLKSIADGATLPEALERNRILWREVEAVVLYSPLEGKRWREAQLLGKASRWPLLDRDEVFSRIGAGVEVERAITGVRGGENAERDLNEFFELCEALPDWQERLGAAMRTRGLREEREILEIADDTSRDTIAGPKGDIPNMAAVNRDRLRTDVRRARLAVWDPDRFADRKSNVQVNVQVNHAERLEEARTRVKRGTASREEVPRAQLAKAIDAVFKPVTVEATPAPQESAVAQSRTQATEPAPVAANAYDLLEE